MHCMQCNGRGGGNCREPRASGNEPRETRKNRPAPPPLGTVSGRSLCRMPSHHLLKIKVFHPKDGIFVTFMTTALSVAIVIIMRGYRGSKEGVQYDSCLLETLKDRDSLPVRTKAWRHQTRLAKQASPRYALAASRFRPLETIVVRAT